LKKLNHLKEILKSKSETKIGKRPI